MGGGSLRALRNAGHRKGLQTTCRATISNVARLNFLMHNVHGEHVVVSVCLLAALMPFSESANLMLINSRQRLSCRPVESGPWPSGHVSRDTLNDA